jgi:antitoxin component HigA of HigAB toxin-antitoxin module
MDIRPIKTEEDYQSILREIESLMRAEPESPEGERLDILVTLVEAYERQKFPLNLSSSLALHRVQGVAYTTISFPPIVTFPWIGSV